MSQRTLRARLHSLKDDILVATSGPTQSQHEELQQLRTELAQAISSLNAVVMDDLAELNRLLEQHRMTPILGVAVDPSVAAPQRQAMSPSVR
jgi:hypothetical protein